MLRVPAPANAACRIVIWTSAEMPFVRTLVCKVNMCYQRSPDSKTNRTNRGFRLATAPDVRSNVAFSFDIAAGTSRE